MKRRYRVALSGYYGFGNLGDELLAEAAVAALLRCGVERSQIVLLSNDPEGSRRRLGTDAVDRWSLRRVCRVLSQSDTLLLGGGGLFQDVTSLRSCVYYWGLVRIARLAGAVPWALGQSVGPLVTRWGRWLAWDALRLCPVAQVRDEPSRLLCENLGLFVEVGHDLTFSVDAVASASALASMRDRFVATTTRPRLVVNLRSGDMARSFADAVSTYARVSALEVWGLAFSEEDEVLMRRFAREGYFPLLRVERATTLSEVLDVLRGVRAAAGMRLHFAILAAAAQVPLVVAPYDPKVEAFAADRQIPLWREGLLPQPLMPLPSSLSSDFLREEIDTLCRRMLA